VYAAAPGGGALVDPRLGGTAAAGLGGTAAPGSSPPIGVVGGPAAAAWSPGSPDRIAFEEAAELAAEDGVGGVPRGRGGGRSQPHGGAVQEEQPRRAGARLRAAGVDPHRAPHRPVRRLLRPGAALRALGGAAAPGSCVPSGGLGGTTCAPAFSPPSALVRTHELSVSIENRN
jgi:hypothetical protein